MSQSSPPFDFSHLNPAERISLAEDLWDSVTAERDAPALTVEQQAELNRRLAASDRGETTYLNWPEILNRLVPPK